jgi:hypothetical protein
MLAARHHITIQLQDWLPAPLRDVYNPNDDDLIFRDPSNADPPVWILRIKPLGFLQNQWECSG